MSNSLLLFVFLLVVLVAAIDIIRRSVEAMMADKRANDFSKTSRRLRAPMRPHITVLVWGDEAAARVTEKSVRRSNYAHFDVVVRIRKRSENAHHAYNLAYKRSGRGEIIVCLRAGEVIDKYFLKRLVILREGRSRWWVEAIQPVASEGVFGLAAALQKALWGSRVSIEANTKHSFLRNLKPGQRIRGQAFAVWALVVLACIVAVAAAGVVALWYSWLLFSIYLLAAVWIAGGASARGMLERSFAVPSALFFLPVTSFIAATLQLSARK